jgi:hypothetical protein
LPGADLEAGEVDDGFKRVSGSLRFEGLALLVELELLQAQGFGEFGQAAVAGDQGCLVEYDGSEPQRLVPGCLAGAANGIGDVFKTVVEGWIGWSRAGDEREPPQGVGVVCHGGSTAR